MSHSSPFITFHNTSVSFTNIWLHSDIGDHVMRNVSYQQYTVVLILWLGVSQLSGFSLMWWPQCQTWGQVTQFYLYFAYCDLCLCVLQSPRSTARSTVQATCAAGPPLSWEQRGRARGRARQTSRTAPTSAAWWRWDVSTPTPLPRLMEKSELNPQSSSHATPWMANSPLLIKGGVE